MATKRQQTKVKEKSIDIGLKQYRVTALANTVGENVGTISIHLNGTHYNLINKTVGEINNLLIAVNLLDKSDDEEDYKVLMNLINPGIAEVEASGNLDVVGNHAYLGGIPRPLPLELATYIKSYYSNGFPTSSLEKFWAFLNLNSDAVCRRDLFKYCQTYGITITKHGYLLFYKAVTTKTKSDKEMSDLRDLVAEKYLSVKRQKKSPSKYVVYQLEDGSLRVHQSYQKDQFQLPSGKEFEEDKFSNLGTLDSLYSNISSLDTNTVYTDKHTGTMDIMLGVPVSQDRALCDPDPNASCSRGLHVGNHNYVRSFANLDDTILLVLVNPRDVVAVPNHDSTKLRCCEYYPTAIVERDANGNWKELTSDYYEDEYMAYQKDQLLVDIAQLKKDLASEKILADDLITSNSDILATTIYDIEKAKKKNPVVKKPIKKKTKGRGSKKVVR